MAKTFGEEDNNDGNDKKDQAAGGDPVPPLPDPPPESIREEAEEGRHLYLDFVRTEIHRNGLAEPADLDRLDGQVTPLTPERYPSTCECDLGNHYIVLDWTRAGRELRQLADAFSRSKERDSVRKRAQSITLESLDFDHWLHLLQELFQGEGVTRERILVLFFFCADVAIEALRKGFHRTFHHLMEWSLKYIATRVAQWVHVHGGWGMVLRSSLAIAYQFTACCAFVAVVAACVVYIRRNLN